MLDFPSSPTPGQPYTSGGMTWVWDGVKWNSGSTGTGVYLPLTGGTLTGQFNVAPAATSPVMVLNKPAGANINVLQGQTVAKARWDLVLGTGAAESTGNLGSDFAIQRHADDGTQIDTPFAINRASGAVISKGTTDGSNAAAGQIGEFITIQAPAAVNLPSSAATTITSLSLTAGDWDVEGNVGVTWSAAGGVWVACLSFTANSIARFTDWTGYTQVNFATPTVNYYAGVTGVARVSLSATTTVYLTSMVSFSSGTASGAGAMRARRVR